MNRIQTWPGYWCEVITGDVLVAAFDTASPDQAMGWLRTVARAYLESLRPTDPNAVRDALAALQRDASRALAGGLAYVCEAGHGDERVMWTAREVWFLPLADREATLLPTCALTYTPPPGAAS